MRAPCADCGRTPASAASARPRVDARPGRTHQGGCRFSPRKPKVVPDAAHPGMWRARWPDARLSDMTNLTRAKDAVACFMETEERRRRGRQRPSEGRLCVKTDSWGKGPAAGMALRGRSLVQPTQNNCAKGGA
jgi:hypothetical protein